MLERLTIKGFQAHTRLVVDLAHPVVSIIGPTDVGKSAILRALHWLALNKPGGDNFINWGSDGAGVFLDVDGCTIARLRARKGNNSYGLRVPGEPKQEFKSFGTKPPDPVADLLNIGEGNFQGQHDSSYWFADTPGNIAKKLNTIINLDVIDDVLGNLNGKVKAYRKRSEDTENRLTRHTTALHDLQPAAAAAACVVVVDGLYTVADSLDLLHADMVDQLAKAKEAAQTKKRMGSVVKDGEAVIKLGDAVVAVDKEIADLGRLVADATKATAQVMPDDLRTDFTDVMRLGHVVHEADEEMGQLQRLLAERDKWNDNYKKASKGLASLKEELGDICPTCGQAVA